MLVDSAVKFEAEPFLVSVYLPTYNRLALLQRAITSVLSQTHHNIELIIVDDGSSDGTTEFLELLRSNDSRVVILKKEGKRGAPASRNKAILNATGKYITGLDDDDFFRENHIELLLKSYDPLKSCCFARHYNWKDKLFSPVFYITKRVSFKQLAYFNIIGNQVFTETWKLKEIGGFDENLPSAQDYDTWLKLLKKFGSAKAIISDTYVCDTQHSMGRITDNQEGKLEAYKYIERKHGFLKSISTRDSFFVRKAILGGDCNMFYILRSMFNPNNFRYSKELLKSIL